MIENLSSKIDSLSGHPPRSENPIVDLYEPENQASTSRPTTLNELHPSQGQHTHFTLQSAQKETGLFTRRLKLLPTFICSILSFALCVGSSEVAALLNCLNYVIRN